MIKIQVEIDSNLVGPETKLVKSVLGKVFKVEGIKSAEVTVIFGDKTLLRELKKKYFDIDRTTDVIAFRLNDYDEPNIEGEIYICLAVAEENAERFNEPYSREINRLIIHGGLHLIGYDDSTDEEQQTMRKLEEKYLN